MTNSKTTESREEEYKGRKITVYAECLYETCKEYSIVRGHWKFFHDEGEYGASMSRPGEDVSGLIMDLWKDVVLLIDDPKEYERIGEEAELKAAGERAKAYIDRRENDSDYQDIVSRAEKECGPRVGEFLEELWDHLVEL